jgi:hypothetical protein
LSDPHVGKQLLSRVDLDPEHVTQRLVACSGQDQLRLLLHAQELGQTGGRVSTHVDRALLERGRRRRRILDVLEDDAVDVRAPRHEEVLVALQGDELAALPLDELERPRADRLQVRRVLQNVPAPVDVLRKNRQQQRDRRRQKGRKRRGEMKHHGVRVGRIDALEHAVDRRAKRMVCLDRFRRELDVVRGDGRPVVKRRAGPQVERERPAVGGDCPPLCQVRPRIELVVLQDQAGEEPRARVGREAFPGEEGERREPGYPVSTPDWMAGFRWTGSSGAHRTVPPRTCPRAAPGAKPTATPPTLAAAAHLRKSRRDARTCNLLLRVIVSPLPLIMRRHVVPDGTTPVDCTVAFPDNGMCPRCAGRVPRRQRGDRDGSD